MSNTCHKCGKPVYFAERKTSLGKDWHPNCLKCEECGKVLTPGQHAEHKGKPYCHQPCYAFNFGPKMMGYGSNVVSPANFKRGQHGTLYNGDYDFDLKKVYESPSPKAKNGASTQHKSSSVYEKSKLTKEEQISGTKQNFNGNNQQERPRSEIFMMGMNNSLPSSRAVTQSSKINKRQQLIQKIKDFNTFYEGKKRQPVVFKDDNDNLVIQGPLRIYWGVEKPIKLQKFDDVPTNSSLGHANWRHSYMPGDSVPEFSGTSNERSDVKESPPSSPRLSRGVDDSMIFTPPEGVVMRKRNIKKFNTVAYRGDSRPNKWKRASINGHIYNYDTGVFTPVIGSCTSVTVDSHCTTDGVIRTLLEKFKIENKPSDFSLYMVSEKKGETLLRSSDIPLLERIALGPDEKSGAKLFLKDHLEMPRKGSLLNFTVPEEEEPDEAKADELTPVVAIEQRLPEEIEQLVALPEPVLQGILIKFKSDEETDIRSVKARYGLVRKKILEQINKLKTAVK